MKAVICEQFGLPETLVLKEVPSPTIDANQVLISVVTAAVNFPDALIIQNKYQFKPTLPFAPGGEIAGRVIAVGKDVSHVQPGDRVVALCGWGGFAEQVSVNANRVFKIPNTINWQIAASTLYNYGTSYHALKDRGQLQPGQTILILGAAGGVGLAAVELAKKMGAIVIAAASNQEKLNICLKKGADFTINYSTEDLREYIKTITAEKGVDLVYDPVGGAMAEPALRSLAWKGRYLVVGFATGTIPSLPFNLALLKGASVVGVFWGAFTEKEPALSMQNLRVLVQMISRGDIQQEIYKVYDLNNASQAIRDLMDRKVMGKAIIQVKEEIENPSIDAQDQIIVKETTVHKMQAVELPVSFLNKSALLKAIGTSLGTSNWLSVDQTMITDFANATLDKQWVHIDPQKAAKLLPDGKTIAHGYLSMSLVSQFLYQMIHIEGVNSFLNYGINKARFINPVQCGDQIRLHASISTAELQDNGSIKLFINCNMEIKGKNKPAYVAEIISLIF
ncbi:MAG: Zn-dependent oxidoreductase [Chitinophagaceae bacterium BSSC1]|nr:MAG: Zn-dependent oxidoreductase [Chitinophagaceae bacterium BSSC1]